MQLETFRGRDVASVSALARKGLGDDAMILETRSLRAEGRSGIEIVAAPQHQLDQLVHLVLRPSALGARLSRPRVVALVGPTGAGKTTTIAKLATHPLMFGKLRVGLLTLDTHRAAGFEQLNAYAEAAGLPCAVAYDRHEAENALKRYAECDIVLVDTAGRGPNADEQRRHTSSLLADLVPDEVHLTVPATLRLNLVPALVAQHAVLRPTHTILTKLDEVPADTHLGILAYGVGLPMRWITDGQDVPTSIQTAASAILTPLGLAHRLAEAA